MEPARWERMWALYEEVVKRPKEDWSPHLEATCPDDAELRAQVQELLSSEAPPESFLEAPPRVPPPKANNHQADDVSATDTCSAA